MATRHRDHIVKTLHLRMEGWLLHRQRLFTAVTALCLTAGPSYAGDGKSDFQKFGDAMQYTMPAVALGITLFEEDAVPALFNDDDVGFRGSIQTFGAWASTQTTVHVLKEITEEARPNNRDNRSFPSGHTASVFSAASFLTTRYGDRPNGWMVSLPAYALALATAASRVDAGEHFLNDTVGGAGLALIWNWVWTTPYPGKYTIAPTAMREGGYGIHVSYRGDPPERFNERVRAACDALADETNLGAEPAADEPAFDPRFRFQLALGPLYFSRNRVQSPSDGTPIDIADFGDDNNPRTTAAMSFDARIAPHHYLHFAVAPFELRSISAFGSPVEFDGTVFPAGLPTRSSLTINLYDSGWVYELPQGNGFDLYLGLGLTMRDWSAELESIAVDDDGNPRQAGDQDRFTAFVRPSLAASWEFLPNFSIHGVIQGMSYGNDWFLNTSAQLRYWLSQHWDLGIGYNFFQSGIETSSVSASSDWHLLALTFGYSFEVHPVETWLGLR